MPESDLVQMERQGRWDRRTGRYGEREARERVFEIGLIFTLLPKLQHILGTPTNPKLFSLTYSPRRDTFFSFCPFTSGVERRGWRDGLVAKMLAA